MTSDSASSRTATRIGERDLVSIVVPAWNEEAGLPDLVARLGALADAADFNIELIIVNDGSTDHTAAFARSLLPRLRKWKLINLSRNFGQQAAYRAGLDHASGAAIVFLDADLQDPPEYILEMTHRWRAGAKVVVGCRASRAEKGLRGFMLRKFHTVFKFLTNGVMPKDSGTFGLMDRVVADHVRALPEVNLFLPALRSWIGFRQEVVWYDRTARSGQPKQTLAKLINYAWDGITSFSARPLKFIGLVGLVISSICFCYAGALIFVRFAQLFGVFPDFVVMGFTTLAVAILFMGGIQLLSLGVIGEYIARSYQETKRRPIYIVESVEGSADDES